MINTTGSERQLIDTLDRISKHSAKYSAVYINISKLQPKNRHPRFVKILTKLFDGLVGAAMGASFTLSNGDFVIVGSKISQEKVNATIKNLKKSMKNDPIIHSTEQSTFIKVYDFPTELSSLYMQISHVATQETTNTQPINIKKSIENSYAESFISKISNVDFTKIIKRQSVLEIKSSNQFNLASQEFFVARKDLAAEIDPNLDVEQNKWMNAYLNEEIDKKILKSVLFSNINNMPKEISLNLAISSIFSSEFTNFIQNFSTNETSVIIEVSLMDVFNNLDLYSRAKQYLHKLNAKILIDEITPSLLNMIDFKELNADYIKIFWEPLMEFENNNKMIKENIEQLPNGSIILAKCPDSTSLKWGLSYSIKAFQGPYIDELETAIIKSKCPNKDNCTNNECLKRKRLVAGAFRDECLHKDVLETILKG